MSHPSDADEIRLKADAAARIEGVCNEFKAAWRNGQQPHIEEFLSRESTSNRGTLLANLLEIEFEFRNRAGEIFRLDQYHQRFPENADQVDAVFRRVMQSRRLGDYELIEEVGQGGMGVVYRARQVFLNQIVAVKVLPQECLDKPEYVGRFRREMQSIGRLEHPNIVRAYNASEAEGVQFLVVEYVDGLNLRRLIADHVEKNQTGLSVGAACEAIRQAALALEHAHQHGLVHRDVKPANLMLSRSGVIKLLDLGLAKFRADQRPVDERSGPVTQAGITMGTIDYMAPEQWEDSSGVDIRADIYSLGCTLYFLLVGHPPYGNKTYDTNRKKLMAHVVAPIPSLRSERPDCPEALDRVLARALAKEPQDRFHTPAELADALAPLAGPQELSAVAAGNTVDQSAVSSKLGIGGAGSDTRNTKSQGFFRFDGSATKRPWYRRPAAVGLAAAAAAVAVGVVIFFSPHDRRPPATGETGLEVALPQGTEAVAGSRQETATTSEHSAETSRLKAELALLPGLNGQWWFDEMPWYTPFARMAVMGAIGERGTGIVGGVAANYLDANIADLQKWLVRTVEAREPTLSPPQQTLWRRLLDLSREDFANDEALADRLAQHLADFVAAQSGGADWTAEDVYARAVLEHKIAEITKHADMVAQAEVHYAEAVARLSAAATNGPPLLRLLCQADSARFSLEVLGDYDRAIAQFAEVVRSEGLPLLFRVETLAECGVAASRAGKYQDNRFQDGQELLEQSAVDRSSHPLLAHVYERHGWSLMEQWHVERAFEEFRAAGAIRSKNRKKNPFASIYVYHNQHGQNIAWRYRGARAQAIRNYQNLIEEIFDELEDPADPFDGPGQQRYRRDLRERYSNSNERLADCVLYQGAASEPRADELQWACQRYLKGIEYADDPGARAAMACKRCVLLALCGGDDLVTAQLEFDAEEVSKREVPQRHQERVGLLRGLAEAVLALARSGNSAEGRSRLRDFLDHVASASLSDQRRREPLETQLFCAELLIASSLAAGDNEAAREDLHYLDGPLAAFPYPDQMLPYLRRPYDLAIRATGTSNPSRLRHYILRSRLKAGQESSATGQDALLLFHFGNRDGIVAFFAPGEAAICSPLTFGRDDIKNAGNEPDPRVRLPDAIVEAVHRHQQAGRAVRPFWSDTACWYGEDKKIHGLSNDQWPFGEQISRGQLVTLDTPGPSP